MPHTPPWLQSILEEHFEELQMLWELRLQAVFDPDYDAADLAELDERIEAHTDGLVLGEEHARPLLLAGLAGDERAVVFAAAYVLLRLQSQETADLVTQALGEAKDEALDGFRDALCHGPIQLITDQLQQLAASAPSAVAAEALAVHAQLGNEPDQLANRFYDDDPHVRGSAWRLVAMLQE